MSSVVVHGDGDSFASGSNVGTSYREITINEEVSLCVNLLLFECLLNYLHLL